MITLIRYSYSSGKEAVKEREAKREWRRTMDPDYISRRSSLMQKLDLRRQSVVSILKPGGQRYNTSSSGILGSLLLIALKKYDVRQEVYGARF